MKKTKNKKNTKSLWDNNSIQFSRLLSEIHYVGLTRKQYKELSQSMDLEKDFIDELFDRAIDDFEGYKKRYIKRTQVKG